MCVDSNFTLLITMPNYCISHTIIGKFFRNGIIRLLDTCIFNVRSCKKKKKNLSSLIIEIYTPTSTTWEFLLLHPANTWYCQTFSFLSVLFIVWICTFLISSVIKHHVVYLFFIQKWHLPIHILCPFFLGLFSLKFGSTFVSYMYFVNLFSESVAWPFTLFIFCFILHNF